MLYTLHIHTNHCTRCNERERYSSLYSINEKPGQGSPMQLVRQNELLPAARVEVLRLTPRRVGACVHCAPSLQEAKDWRSDAHSRIVCAAQVRPESAKQDSLTSEPKAPRRETPLEELA